MGKPQQTEQQGFEEITRSVCHLRPPWGLRRAGLQIGYDAMPCNIATRSPMRIYLFVLGLSLLMPMCRYGFRNGAQKFCNGIVLASGRNVFVQQPGQ